MERSLGVVGRTGNQKGALDSALQLAFTFGTAHTTKAQTALHAGRGTHCFFENSARSSSLPQQREEKHTRSGVPLLAGAGCTPARARRIGGADDKRW